MKKADIVLHLDDGADFAEDIVSEGAVWRVQTKADLSVCEAEIADLVISTKNDVGVDSLLAKLADYSRQYVMTGEHQIVTRQRHLVELKGVAAGLDACGDGTLPLEIRAEYLRQATDALGRFVGLVDIEDVLDRLFAGFCIGK